MRLKNIFYTAILMLSITLLASCLGEAHWDDIEDSRNAQVHSFSMESRADTEGVLRNTRFFIDQVNGQIFNRDFLPYQFWVDSVMLTIVGGTGGAFRGALSEIRVHLINPDTNFVVVRDSVPLNRLHRIETFAANPESSKMYDIHVNIFQQNPFLITWVNTGSNYVAQPIQSQKTISLNNSFFTYYISNGVIGAKQSAANEGITWTPVPLTGLSADVQLSSAISIGTAAFVLDATNNVFRTDDGINWSAVNINYPVIAIYGVLPSTTGGDLVLVVDNNGVLTFAKTDDFTNITLLNPVPAPFIHQLPVTDFSAVSVDNPYVYAATYLIFSGGNTLNGLENSDIWLIEYANGVIRLLRQATGLLSQRGSRLFFYNNQLYMLTMTLLGENTLMFSANYGITWEVAVEGQSFPADFTHRTHATVITDDYFIWLFGGQTALGEFSDVWRGRLNRLDEVQ